MFVASTSSLHKPTLFLKIESTKQFWLRLMFLSQNCVTLSQAENFILDMSFRSSPTKSNPVFKSSNLDKTVCIPLHQCGSTRGYKQLKFWSSLHTAAHATSYHFRKFVGLLTRLFSQENSSNSLSTFNAFSVCMP